MKQCPNPKCKEANEDEALYCHLCGTKLDTSALSDDIDGKILDIISQNSFSKRPLAAYEARKYAEMQRMKTKSCNFMYGDKMMKYQV